ncbi:cytidine and deoxycytidylate deaminase zinc-binding region protein [Ceratobasidium sp. AG-Ba]|nr:cytidine and deoxycytidylate deaminase zinc-binding region protein [Ceratobasidium sp. AG-Ba]QRW15170.1 cytidine and deoxycytidylate deaminase zinc-binding region protein [Ceratobasidium sp. AG-Ba]
MDEILEQDDKRIVRPFNTLGLIIKDTDGKGRGVFATSAIPAREVVEISPVLLFTPEEYVYAKLTIIDHYTFVWNDVGRSQMALPLGLGSIFNHSRNPNISYRLDKHLNVIEYATTRQIQPGEELCIYYASDDKLWFKIEDSGLGAALKTSAELGSENIWDDIAPLPIDKPETEEPPVLENMINQERATKDASLAEKPLFRRIKVRSTEEIEEADGMPVPTIDVWVVDVGMPSILGSIMEIIRKHGFDSDDLRHLKRVRTVGGLKSVVLARSTVPLEDLPELPEGTGLPYIFKVPKRIATSHFQLGRKNAIWPVGLNPHVSPEVHVWSSEEIEWLKDGIYRAVDAAVIARNAGELPIGAFVAPAFGGHGPTVTTHDERENSGHPLRHAAQAAVRRIAEIRAGAGASTAEIRNGASYLLTGLTLFTTHEPCIMCSMSLLHSRVARIVYIHPMVCTGGCNEEGVCLPALDGVNHRFEIIRWYGEQGSVFDFLKLPEDLDA